MRRKNARVHIPQLGAKEGEMPKFLLAKILIIGGFVLIFYFGIAGLRSGEIRSRGYLFKRGESPVGYWSTVLITLVGPVIIIYLVLTR